MKKLFISLLAMAATLNAMALDINYSAKATLGLKANTSEQTCNFTLGETDFAQANKLCAEINMEGRQVALYAIANSKNYQIYANADVEGLPLGFLTNADTEYTITFSNVIGTLYLVDAVANKTTEITAGGSYAFTAEANQTIADRFSITKVLPAKPYSFINNVLVINEATVGAEVTVTPFTYEATGKVPGTSATYPAPVNQVLNGGYFLVTYTNAEGVAREFIVNANPNVQPAND